MANVTAWNINTRAALMEASTTVATITLLPEFEYELTHLTTDAAGASDVEPVMLSVSGGTPATPAETTGVDKLILTTGAQLRIGPGVSAMKYDCPAGTPAFNITMNTDRQ